jgi:hypothetical protein
MTLEATVVRLLIGRHPLITLAEKQASPDGHYLVSARVPEVRATLEGLEGDRHAGFTRRADARVPQYPRGTEIHNSRQVSLVAEEELAAIAANMGVPVIEPEWIGANLVLRGVIGWVERAGMIRAGDTVRIDIPDSVPCRVPEMAIR